MSPSVFVCGARSKARRPRGLARGRTSLPHPHLAPCSSTASLWPPPLCPCVCVHVHACVHVCACALVCAHVCARVCGPASVRPVSLRSFVCAFVSRQQRRRAACVPFLTSPSRDASANRCPAPAPRPPQPPQQVLQPASLSPSCPPLRAHLFSCKGRCWQGQGGARRSRKGGDVPCRACLPDPVRPQPHQCVLWTVHQTLLPPPTAARLSASIAPAWDFRLPASLLLSLWPEDSRNAKLTSSLPQPTALQGHRMKNKHLAFPARPCLGRLLLTVPRPPLTTLLLHAPPAPRPALVPLSQTRTLGEGAKASPASRSKSRPLVTRIPWLTMSRSFRAAFSLRLHSYLFVSVYTHTHTHTHQLVRSFMGGTCCFSTNTSPELGPRV